MARRGALTPVAITGPGRAVDARLATQSLGDVAFVTAEREDIEGAILGVRGSTLADRADCRTPALSSCRGWRGGRAALGALVAAAGIVAAFWLWPTSATIAITIWAAVTLVAVTGLRTIAALVQLRHVRRSGRMPPPIFERDRLPSMSILVPLYREREIVGDLVRRLQSLDYPSDRLEIALILEADDPLTEAALAETDLPPEMRVIRTPAGGVRTKPRALNYALDFTCGDIVGVYDAEDAPSADQLLRVAAAFEAAPPEVACLQGILDFYNAPRSWLTRCFTIDYATWFRLVLPGLVRLGMVIPLGGTTVFFRRAVLEELGRWDAHNVTEDADLGLRLARRGFRTEFVDSVTEEEATATLSAWIRQRSRWIKGYAITWCVHMRDPLTLLGELGPLRFVGVQILFLGTLSQFVLAPLLWSFWLVLAGLPHPFVDAAPWEATVLLASLFFFAEVATIAIAALSVAAPEKRWLIKWVPMIHLYFPLAAVASWKAIVELFWRPFFWDKTAHGHGITRRPGRPPWRPRRRPA